MSDMKKLQQWEICQAKAENLGLKLSYSTEKFTIVSISFIEYCTSLNGVEGFLRGYQK